VKEEKEIEAYTTWNKFAGYHGAFPWDNAWVSNNSGEHAEAFFCDRGLHVVHRGNFFFWDRK
jgi:hypothetical protein